LSYDRGVVRHASLAALLLFTVIACGACSSVPKLTFDEAEGGVSVDGGDAGPCVKTGVEICDDGIDNDCDGKTDCADNSCQQRFTCVDAAPDDWTLTALADGARPNCPTGFDEAKDVRTVVGESGPAACACDCSGAASCAPAGIVAAFDNDSGCNANTETFAVKSSCERVSINLSANTFVKATAGTASACGGSKNGVAPPVRDSRTCALPKVGGGCGSGQVCVPRANNNFALCVSKPGSIACPGAFPSTRHAGTNASDSRTCGTCTCTASPCTGELHLFDNKDCSNDEKLKITATASPGACGHLTNGGFQARGYTSTVTGGCVMTGSPQGAGTLSLSDETTICCK
jgi:hypothetical protein